MPTCSTIITRALRRIRVLSAAETASAEDAELGLSILNSMLLRWPALGVDAKYSALVLADTFYFFVPPAAATSEVIDALDYQGTWDANTNSPALADGTGTKGYYYRVATAGTTDLDDLASWAVNDFAVFDGSVWLKSINSSQYEQSVVDMLAVELTPDFGVDLPPVLARAASQGWMQIQAAFIKAPTAILDRAVMDTMQFNYVEQEVDAGA